MGFWAMINDSAYNYLNQSNSVECKNVIKTCCRYNQGLWERKVSITFDAASKLDKVVTLPYTILPTLLIPYIENYINII